MFTCWLHNVQAPSYIFILCFRDAYFVSVHFTGLFTVTVSGVTVPYSRFSLFLYILFSSVFLGATY